MQMRQQKKQKQKQKQALLEQRERHLQHQWMVRLQPRWPHCLELTLCAQRVRKETKLKWLTAINKVRVLSIQLTSA